MQSCLYQGSVFHARREPVSHRFRYSVAMAYLDLDEATQLLRESWLASASRWSPVGFRADDHLLGVNATGHDDDVSGAPAQLADEVRRHVADAGQQHPAHQQ